MDDRHHRGADGDDRDHEHQVGEVVVGERRRVVVDPGVVANFRPGEEGGAARDHEDPLDGGAYPRRYHPGDQPAKGQNDRSKEKIVDERTGDEEPGQVGRPGIDVVTEGAPHAPPDNGPTSDG